MTFISFTEISITTDGGTDGIKPDNFLLDFFSSKRIGEVEYS